MYTPLQWAAFVVYGLGTLTLTDGAARRTDEAAAVPTTPARGRASAGFSEDCRRGGGQGSRGNRAGNTTATGKAVRRQAREWREYLHGGMARRRAVEDLISPRAGRRHDGGASDAEN